MCNFYVSELLQSGLTWGQARLVTFTLQAYGKTFTCFLLRVNESKPPNYFSIMEDYLIGDDPGAA